MKRRNVVAFGVTGMVMLVVGGWWFFAERDPGEADLSVEERRAVLSVQDERLSKGSPDAPVTIIEYIDVLCPYCAKASQPGDIIPRMMTEYVDTNKARYEVRLVAKTAPDSERAGQGAYCAAEQKQFWPYIDKAYEDTWRQYYSQDRDVTAVDIFKEASIFTFVRSIPEIDHLRWQACMKSNSYSQTMEDNAAEMSRLKAYGTPTMVVDGKSYTGTPPYEAFRAVINASLNEKKAQKDRTHEADQ
ncbi:MAG: DsbA family protein [Candidatus Saccharimonadales bacterium]